MRKDRLQKVESIFQAAAELSAEDREAVVAARCGDDAELRALVERLLRHHADGMDGFLEPEVAQEIPADGASTNQPSRIGPYDILEPIGEGGMGTVFLAEQTAPIHRRVALKVIKLGMDTQQVIARFEMERQALALMDHPGIARVFDAGATPEGRPYFVMEYVQGIPINAFCDDHGLSIQERLELFMQVCGAVQHAHQKGIIHRDLKPANILVADVDGRPVAKVIDFGVAKATAQPLDMEMAFTAAGQMVGTPAYMSPEQADTSGLNVDTRTDVYTLGVILYELLAGVLPYDLAQLRQAGISALLKVLQETDSPRPSTRLSSLGGATNEIAGKRGTDPRRLVGQLRGDLDWIVMCALEKDRERRYGSPGEMAQDIARHLRHKPVLAGPPSAVYRSRKFVRRHRVALSFVALVFLGITSALVESNRQQNKVEAALVVAEEERAHAIQEAEKAEQVSQFLQRLLGTNDPFDARHSVLSEGEREFARRLLDRAAENIEVGLANQPEVLAEVQDVIGTTYQGLDLREEARPLLEAALALRRELHGKLHPDVATSLEHWGFLAQADGEFLLAKSSYSEALEIRRTVLGERHPDTATSLAYLGGLEWEYSKEANYFPSPYEGRIDRAEQFMRESLAIRTETGDVLVRGISGCNRVLALIHAARGEYAAALSCARTALEARLALVGPDHYLVSWDLEDLARVRLAAGDPASAEPLLRRALAIRVRQLDADHKARYDVSKYLGDCLAAQGKYASADSFYVEVLAWCREFKPTGNSVLQMIPIAIANARRAMGDSAGAEVFVYESLAWARGEHGRQSLEYASALRALAEGYYPPGSDAAYLANREALSIRQSLLGDDKRTVVSLVFTAESLGRVETRGPARFATVDSLFGEARRMQVRNNDGEVPWWALGWLLEHWGAALLEQGRADEAEPILREEVAVVGEHREEYPVRLATAESAYGACLAAQGRGEEAESYLLRSYAVLRVREPAGSSLRATLERLAALYRDRGDEEHVRDYEAQLTALE